MSTPTSYRLTPAEYAERNSDLFRRRVELVARRERATKAKAARLDAEIKGITSEIVRLNTPLVRNYVNLFAGSSRSADDIADHMGAGIVGLMVAINTYDPEQAPFPTWAWNKIKREVLRSVRDRDFPHLLMGDFEARPKVRRARAVLAERFGVAPEGLSPEDLADEAGPGVSVRQVSRVLTAVAHTSVHKPVETDDGTTELGDLLADAAPPTEEIVEREAGIAALERYALPVLTDRERFVVVRSFGLDGEPPMRMSTIGRLLGLTREATRQIRLKALSRMAHPTIMRKLLHP